MKQRQCNSRMPLSVVSFGWSSEFLAPKCKVYTPLFRIRTTFDILWLVTNSMKNGIIIKNLLKQTKVICIHTPEHCYFLSRYLGRTQEYNFVILARELERQVLMLIARSKPIDKRSFTLLTPKKGVQGSSYVFVQHQMRRLTTLSGWRRVSSVDENALLCTRHQLNKSC